MNTLLKKAAATLAVGITLATTSCIGPNNLYNQVHTWNSKVSDSKYLNELLFLGMNIVPVYGVCWIGDHLIFNSVEFWSGKNWVNKAEEFKPQEK